ncbi:hypothetical protein [Akkermansia sp.]
MNIKIRPAAREDVQKTSAPYDDFLPVMLHSYRKIALRQLKREIARIL